MAGLDDRTQLLQKAPYPDALHDLVDRLSYREDRGWKVSLQGVVRDYGPNGEALSEGLTLIVQRCGPDTYHPENTMRVNHYFPVPPATYNRRSWMRWLFDRLGDVDTHERCEDFVLEQDEPNRVGAEVLGTNRRVVRPFAPNHSPGNDPYSVRELGTVADAETSFRGERKEGSQRLLADDPAAGSFQEIDGI